MLVEKLRLDQREGCGANLKLDGQELVPWEERSEESKEAKFTDIWRDVLKRRTSWLHPGSIKKVSVKM